ncbi:hypothetical protein [Candidatus Thioglobus sp.]|uniref:hypothetical protein n=1 Tax=Candidatus Thioglobus sp. TaxID=2026721 RepID=UPI003D148FE0
MDRIMFLNLIFYTIYGLVLFIAFSMSFNIGILVLFAIMAANLILADFLQTLQAVFCGKD